MNTKDWLRLILLLSFVFNYDFLSSIKPPRYDYPRQFIMQKSINSSIGPTLQQHQSLTTFVFNNISSTLKVQTSLIPLFLSSNSLAYKYCPIAGLKTNEPEDKWKPNLRSPFGLLPCVLCQCVSLQKKSRTVSRVRCKNIISQCPKPSCSDPILLPGQCCKICPDSETGGDEFEDDLAPFINIDIESLCESWRMVPRAYRQFMKKNRICSKSTQLAIRPSPPTSSTAKMVPKTGIIPSTSRDNLLVFEPSNTFYEGTVQSNSKHRKCFHENQVFDEGSLWKSSNDACKMCSCQKGQVKCDSVVCPTPQCLNPVTSSGDCCPLCLGKFPKNDFNGHRNCTDYFNYQASTSWSTSTFLKRSRPYLGMNSFCYKTKYRQI